MARQQAKTLVDKFLAAENDIDCALKRYENHVGNQIANVASSSLSAELKLEAFIVAVRECKEWTDLRQQIFMSLKACKVEVFNVNSGFLKFIHLNVGSDNKELARLLGLETDVKKECPEEAVKVRQTTRKSQTKSLYHSSHILKLSHHNFLKPKNLFRCRDPAVFLKKESSCASSSGPWRWRCGDFTWRMGRWRREWKTETYLIFKLSVEQILNIQPTWEPMTLHISVESFRNYIS